MKTRNLMLAASALSLASAPALADFSAQAVTDLNLRVGPGPRYDIITVIDQDANAKVEGCLEAGNWCKVSYNGKTGWAYGQYLTTDLADSYVPIVSDDASIEVGTVTFENEDHDDAVVGGGLVGAVAGAIIGGPVGAAAGAIAGGAAGAAVEPSQEVVSYVQANEHDPIYLEGEVVTGVKLPDTVDLYDIPNEDYEYVYVNGVPVLVDGETRTVVHVFH